MLKLGLKDKLKEMKKNRENRQENIIQGVEETYQQGINDGTKEEAIQLATQEVIAKIKRYPEIASKILQSVQEAEIPNDVIIETATQISEDPHIANETITNAGKELPDSIIANIINNAEMEEDNKINLIEKIKDVSIRQEVIKRKLKEMYVDCQKETDILFVSRLVELQRLSEQEEVNDLMQRCIAKKLAHNYAQFGMAKTSTFKKILFPEEMFQMKMPDKVQEEYDKIEAKDKQVYDRQEFRIKLLRKIAKEVVSNYDPDIGEFYVPYSNEMKNITKEEENAFFEKLQIEFENRVEERKLTTFEIRNIQQQIQGGQSADIKSLVDLYKNFPNENAKQFLSIAKKWLQEAKEFETYLKISDSGIVDLIKELPEEEQAETLKGIKNVLMNRLNRKKIAKETPKIKEIKIHKGEGR